MDTTPRHGDSDNVLLKKITQLVHDGGGGGASSSIAPVVDENGVERFQATFNSEDDGESVIRDVSGTVRARFGRDISGVGPTEIYDSFAKLRFSATSDGAGAGYTRLTNADEFPVFEADETSTRLADASGTVTMTVQSGVVIQKTFIVSGLPSAATVGAGARAFVTDANATLIVGLGLTAVGGGSNKVPVYSDGTNWKIG